MKIMITFLVTILFAGITYATDICGRYRYLAVYQGSCIKAIFLGQERANQCEGKAGYGLLRDGRGVFDFYVEGVGNIYFWGSEKSKPNLEDYRLLLNRVELPNNETRPRGMLPAKGVCSITRVTKTETVLSCNATIADGSLDFELRSKESPDVEDCDKLPGESEPGAR